MSAPPSMISGEFAGRYTVERELGRGATAIVYLARDTEYGRAVAIKVLRDELAESMTAERFLREIRVTSQLHHPHIVPVLASGEDSGRLFFVLPFMDGGTLRERLTREKQLPIHEVIAIGTRIGGALASAHERNLLHRDVKPENILYTGGQACLSDFGIARMLVQGSGESTTSTGIIRGTPAYMSPEQASGDREYDGRSDIYSLACVLYEALAGVPAFIGASSQAVVAQRMSHPPRPVGVYRPSVSLELQTVLERALAIAPADRFQTAREFVEALERVPSGPTLSSEGVRVASGSARPQATGLRRRGAFYALGAVAIVAALLYQPVSNRIALRQPLDTTRVLILPFDDPTHSEIKGDDLLHEAMRRWKGLALVESFEVGDAVRRHGFPATTDEARAIARELGAGRFVRGRITSAEGGVRVSATLFDTRSRESLHGASFVAPRDSASSPYAYYGLGDSLALRGARVGPDKIETIEGRNLPATQAMLRAASAMNEWDLPAAESLYAKALEYEPTSSRTAFWLAQVRSWRSSPRESWRELAANGARDSLALTDDERRLADALSALGRSDFPRACRLYRALTERSPRDFAAWFGLGQCIDQDRTVLADARSPSRWRFRSSYQRAIDAYLRAFELLPSVYRGYQSAAYSQLVDLLYVSSRNRRMGVSEAIPAGRFMASPVLESDTLVFTPYRMEDWAAGTVGDPAATARAVERMRQIFRRITTAWAAAFPESPGAKEGMALSLELQGDPAAIDTLNSALHLASDPPQRLHLLGGLTWLQLKFGIQGRVELLRAARKSADSTLRDNKQGRQADAEILGRFAALTGHCSAAAEFARRNAKPLRGALPVPQHVVADAQARLAFAAIGCKVPDSIPSLRELSARAGIDHLPASSQLAIQQQLFARELRISEPLDSSWASRLALGGDYLLTTRIALARGDVENARRTLTRIAGIRRSVMRGGIPPDGVVAEVQVWLAIGDTASAIEWLDRVLSDARYFPPMLGTDDNLVLIASAIRAAALVAELTHDRRDAARWARAVLTLWDGADPDLQPTIQRMQRLARGRS